MKISIHQQKTNENELTGIIWKLKNEYNISNPISSRLVVPSSSLVTQGKLSTLVLWDRTYLQVMETNNVSWVQLSFPNSLIFPSAYSLRGVMKNDTVYPLCFSKAWNVFGILEKGKKKELISSNSVNESQYCAQSSGNCYDLLVGSFDINKNISDKGYTAIRWETTELGGTCTKYFFSASAIDVYGVLVPRYSICSMKRLQGNGKSFTFIMILITLM